MGSLLGPADGLYQWLGEELSARGDVAAACDLIGRAGGRRFIVMGHSFGGAVAVQAGVVLGEHCAGVVGLATQSAGCEFAAELGATPLLLLHGTDDAILPPETSNVVQMLAGHGEVVLLPGTNHLLSEAVDEVRERVLAFVTENLS
jgi:pimeloyl-ACP methyl ester carboxylesterase